MYVHRQWVVFVCVMKGRLRQPLLDVIVFREQLVIRKRQAALYAKRVRIVGTGLAVFATQSLIPVNVTKGGLALHAIKWEVNAIPSRTFMEVAIARGMQTVEILDPINRIQRRREESVRAGCVFVSRDIHAPIARQQDYPKMW